MCDLYEVIYFYASLDHSRPDRSTVDGYIGTQFYIIFNDYIAYLRDLVKSAFFIRFESKAV